MRVAKVYALSPNFSDYVILRVSISSMQCTFLLDTQADITLLKERAIDSMVRLDTRDQIKITGITEEPIWSLGSIEADLIGSDFRVTHNFHVVPNGFYIPSDGIIGKDFLKKFGCNFSYVDMTMSFWLKDREIVVPILEGPTDDTMVVPARCEVVRKIRLEDVNSMSMVDSQEIARGVFVARTLVSSDTPLVRVINTTDEVMTVKNNCFEVMDLKDYNVYSVDKVTRSAERMSKLSELLKKNIPEFALGKVMPLCEEFSDIFALDTDRMTVNNFYTQKLRVSDDKPVYIKNYRLPQSQKAEVHAQVEKLLENDFIEPSASNFNSPIIIVPKPSIDGAKRWRMCLDYRQVNKRIVADKFPLPRIDDILDGLGRARHFSIIDLFQGFHQIPLDEDSRDITSFSTDKGSYRWKVLPFGLSVCPNSFSRMMSIAFSGITPDQAFLYIDDVIVIGYNEIHHLENLRKVFEAMRRCNLKLNPLKCKFFRSEVTFLGHRCTAEGILPDESKKQTIENYPIPLDKDAVRRFVAFANYYRRFIPNFSLITRPLNSLTRKTAVFEWTKLCQEAFDLLKKSLLSPTILRYPDFTKDFLVTVDASKWGCGAVLSQNYDGVDLPVYFASKKFLPADQKKSTPEQECLAIHFALNQFKPYIYGRFFVVRSDHQSLIYLFSHKNPSPKLTRIRVELEDFDFAVEHIRGKDNVVADALSRITIDDLKDLYGKTASVFPVITRSMTKKNDSSNDYPILNDEPIRGIDIKVIELLDASMDKSIPRIRSMIYRNNFDERFQMGFNVYQSHRKIASMKFDETLVDGEINMDYVLSTLNEIAIDQKIKRIQWHIDDVIFTYVSMEHFKQACQRVIKGLQIVLIRRPITVNDESEKIRLMTDFHDNPVLGGHCGQKRLYAKLRSRFYWRNMPNDVAKFVKSCSKCQVTKVRPKNKEQLVLTSTPQKPFDILVIDTIGPLTMSTQGSKYAVTMICDLSKYLVIAPTQNKEASSVAKAIFKNFVLIYGLMKEIRTDRGTEYLNELVGELCKLLRANHETSTSYHPQTVGTVERSHRTLNEFIRSYISDQMDQWETYAGYFAFCYNITNHSSLNHVYSPFELVFGKKANLPTDLLNGRIDPIYDFDNFVKEAKYRLQTAHVQAKSLVEKVKIRNKEYYDKSAKPLIINIGDKILVKREPYDKHGRVYDGPFTVHNASGSNVTFFHTDKNVFKTLHKDRIVRYV